jgi:hypothetical protein
MVRLAPVLWFDAVLAVGPALMDVVDGASVVVWGPLSVPVGVAMSPFS